MSIALFCYTIFCYFTNKKIAFLSRKNREPMNENTTKELYRLFQDPTSKFFLETNTEKLYEKAKQESKLYPVTREEIQHFKHSIETISRSFETRLLRSRQRHLHYRKWITYAPLNILLGI